MSHNAGFSVVLVRQDGPQKLYEGSMASISDIDPNIVSTYTTGKCDNCDQINVLEGDFECVSSNQRQMGRERIYVSRHWAECVCGASLALKIDYMEYPRGTLQPYEIRPIRNVSYFPVYGFMYPVDDAVRQVRNNQEAMRSSVDEIQQMVDADVLQVSDEPALESTFDKLVETVENNILVLGSYRGASEPELMDVRDELDGYDYDAYLFNELPDIPYKDLEQNVATAMRMVGFCVMVDREASGHIDEYKISQNQRTVLARLTPEDGGSTRMIGGPELVDINHIKKFEFDVRPQEVLSEAVEWAEEMIDERREAYDSHYEWRD